MSKTVTKEIDIVKPRFGVVAGEGNDLTRDQIVSILKKRAVNLSKTPTGERETGSIMQLVTFSLGDETYGMNIALIQEIQPLKDLTLIPCTPDFVVGAVNIRGKIITVVDICRLFGLPNQTVTDNSKVIVVHHQDLEIGILADEVSEVISVSQSEMEHPLATLSGVREEYIKGEYVLGVTKKMLVILDVESIIKDKRMVIHEEVS